MLRKKLARAVVTQCVTSASPAVVTTFATFVALVTLAGCPGDYGGGRDKGSPVPDSPQRFDQGPQPDITGPTFDTGPKLDGPPAEGPSPDQGPACSAAGVAAGCKPSDGSGCGANASCYLVTATGPSCVCPAGTKGVGSACNTTVECQPGLACAGNTAPGTCAKMCDPNGANTCGVGEKCTPFTPFPAYGACL